MVMVFTIVLQHMHFLSLGDYLRKNVEAFVCLHFRMYVKCVVLCFHGRKFTLRLVRLCVRLTKETGLVAMANRCFFVDDIL
jgi:hypothetical protein